MQGRERQAQLPAAPTGLPQAPPLLWTWGLEKLRLVVWEWLLNPPASLPPLGTLVGLWAREGGGHGG